MNNISFKLFNPSESQKCIEIFNSNVPKYFKVKEEEDLRNWLTKTQENPYYLMYSNEILVGCGGVFFDHSKKIAGFAWGIIHQDFHKKGFGRELSNFRLTILDQLAPNYLHELSTSQFTYIFFEKIGFQIESIQKDGWFKGMDKYYMIRKK